MKNLKVNKGEALEAIKKNRNLLVAGFLAATILPTDMLAADLPAILTAYRDIISNIVVKVVVVVAILIMLVYSGYEAKENGNARPFKWALFGSVVMAGAVFFGPSLVDFMQAQIGGGVVTGAGAVVTEP